jgi:L-aspartate oxidase
MVPYEIKYSDYLVIGSGIAGLIFALESARCGKVNLISKQDLKETNTQKAQGGIAAALAVNDSPQLHYEDTLKAGAGLCNPEAVKILTARAPEFIKKLIGYGAKFDKFKGSLALGKEGAHSLNRVVHARGDATGSEVERALIKSVSLHPNICCEENVMALDLIIIDNSCIGVWAWDKLNFQLRAYLAPFTFMATGGIGQLFSCTTNSCIATGDGMAMAYRAGAALMDMEFIQFHPTALFSQQKSPYFLISEALRGEGAILRNIEGKPFMQDYDSEGELAARDIVSRAIYYELRKTQSPYVYLDIAPIANFASRFPGIFKACLKYNVDLSKSLIPVTPAMHYVMGGVLTDTFGASGIKNLYAAGEVACTGVHGANRLASNSLVEGMVFAAQAWEQVSQKKGDNIKAFKKLPLFNEYELFTFSDLKLMHSYVLPFWEMRKTLQKVMWQRAGIVRCSVTIPKGIDKLAKLEREFQALEHDLRAGRRYIYDHKITLNLDPFELYWELKNMLLLARLIFESALAREESRGAHFRSDFPESSKGWLKHIVLQKSEVKIRGVKGELC